MKAAANKSGVCSVIFPGELLLIGDSKPPQTDILFTKNKAEASWGSCELPPVSPHANRFSPAKVASKRDAEKSKHPVQEG